MKKLLITAGAVVIIAVAAITGYSQNAGEVEWLSGIDKKAAVTYGDAAAFFVMQIGKSSSGFDNNQSALAAEGIALQGYSEESILTKGMLSKMTAKYLKLGGSFMYLIFKTERYAYKVCVANGIFTEDGSSNDVMSGPGMIEAFSKISDIKGESK